MQLHIKTAYPDLYSLGGESTDFSLDLFFPEDVVIPGNSSKTINLKVKAILKDINPMMEYGNLESLYKYKYFWITAKKSISNTPLRFENNIKYVDSHFRDSLEISIDNTSEDSFIVKCGERLFQIVAGNLEPFDIIIHREAVETF